MSDKHSHPITSDNFADFVRPIVTGSILKQWRNDAHMTLKEVTAKSNITRSHLNDLELGKVKSPDIEKIRVLARLYNADPRDIFFIEETKKYRQVLRGFQDLYFYFLEPLGLQTGLSADKMIDLIRDRGAMIAEAFSGAFKSKGITKPTYIEAFLRASRIEKGFYYPELEREAAAFRKKLGLKEWSDDDETAIHKHRFDVLKAYLEEEYKYEILQDDGFANMGVKHDLTWLYVPDTNKPRIVLHPHLSPSRQSFLLAREAYFADHNIVERRSYTREPHFQYQYVQQHQNNPLRRHTNFYNGSYFAGAVLLPEDSFTQGIEHFFAQDEWDDKAFLNCAMGTTPTTFMIRLAQLLREKIGLTQYNYIRFDYYNDGRGYRVTDELNMMDAIDSSVFLDLEIPIYDKHLHQCRRWLAIELINELNPVQRNSQVDEHYSAKARQAVFRNGMYTQSTPIQEDLNLFVFAIASTLPIAGRRRAVSLAIELNDEFKDKVTFWNSRSCQPSTHASGAIKVENKVCELCAFIDCKERADITHKSRFRKHLDDNKVAPWLKEEWDEREDKRMAISAYIKEHFNIDLPSQSL